MSTASRADLEALFGEEEIAQRESVLPAGAVARALADADAQIDSYLAARYVLPLSILPLPGNLVRAACVIARYYLLGDAATERARQDWQDAITWLRDVQAGRARIEGADQPTAASAAHAVMATGRPRVFSGGMV